MRLLPHIVEKIKRFQVSRRSLTGEYGTTILWYRFDSCRLTPLYNIKDLCRVEKWSYLTCFIRRVTLVRIQSRLPFFWKTYHDNIFYNFRRCISDRISCSSYAYRWFMWFTETHNLARFKMFCWWTILVPNLAFCAYHSTKKLNNLMTHGR